MLKRGFGFGGDEDDPLYADPEEPAVDSAEVRSAARLPDVEVQAPEMTEDARRAIFDHVVAVFNEAQPDFFRKSLNPEAQKKYIYDTLDGSLKDYLSELARQAQARCEQQWQGEHSTMASEMESLREKAREVEQQRLDIQQRQLSADRQKRALADRVHDLEAQIARLEAEQEQYDLENKSLVNKLKVANCHQEEAERLTRELEALRGNPESAVSELDARLAAVSDENASLSEALENMREKQRVADEMMAQMRAKLQEKSRELDEANGMLGELDEIHAQMLKMDEVMKKREAKVARLRDKNARLEAQVEELTRKLAAVAEPAALTDDSVKAPVGEPDDTLKISDTDLSAMEETFENADWMSNEPPAASLSALSVRQPVEEDPDFGYHAPKRRPLPADNGAQMSLF